MFIYKSIKNKLKGEPKNFNLEDEKQYDVSKLVGVVQNKNGILKSLFINSENNPSLKPVLSDREITLNVKGNSTFEVHTEASFSLADKRNFKNTDSCHDDQPQVAIENHNLKTYTSSTLITNPGFKSGSIESLKHFKSACFDEKIVARKSVENTILTSIGESNSYSKSNFQKQLSKKTKKRKPAEVKLDVVIDDSLSTLNSTCDNVATSYFPPLEEAKSSNKKTDVGNFNKSLLLHSGTNSKVQRAQLVISSASSVIKSTQFTPPIFSSKIEHQRLSTETNSIGNEQLQFSKLSVFSRRTQSHFFGPSFIKNECVTIPCHCFPSHEQLSTNALLTSRHLIVKQGAVKSQKSTYSNILFESLPDENFPPKEGNDALESDRNTHKNYEIMKLHIDNIYNTEVQKISKLAEKYGLDKKITPEVLLLTNEEAYQLWNTCVEQIWNFKKQEKEESLESSDDEPNKDNETYEPKLDHLENSIIFDKDIGCKGYINFLIPRALKIKYNDRVNPNEDIKMSEQFAYSKRTNREKSKSKPYHQNFKNNYVPSTYVKSKSQASSETSVNNSPKLDNSLMKDSSETFHLCEDTLGDKISKGGGQLSNEPQNQSISEIKIIIKETATKLMAKNEERKKVFKQIISNLKETFLNQCSDCTKPETVFNPVNLLFDEKIKYENADNRSLFNEDAHKSLFDFDSALHRNIQSSLSHKLIVVPTTFQQKNQKSEEEKEECLSEFNSPEDCPAYEKPSILTDDIKKLQVQLACIFSGSLTKAEEDSDKPNNRSIKSSHEHVRRHSSHFYKKPQNYKAQYENIQQKDIQTVEKEYLMISEEDDINNTVEVGSSKTSVEHLTNPLKVEHLINPLKVETPINPMTEESSFNGEKRTNQKSSEEARVKKSKLGKCNYSIKTLKELLKSSQYNSKLHECIVCYEKVKDFGFQNEMEFIAVDSTCYTENVDLLYPYIGKLHGIKKIFALKTNISKKLLKVIGGLEKYDSILDCSLEIYRSLNDRQFPIACNTKKNKSTNWFLKKACKRLNEHWNGMISPLAYNDDAIRDLQTKQTLKNLNFEPSTASVYKADGGRIFVLLNYEEHVRVVVSDKRGDLRRVVSEATDILKIIEGYVNLHSIQFSWSNEFGFLNSNPLKLGIACKITVQVVLENINKVGCIDACKKKFKVEIEHCALNKKSKQNTYRIISTEQFGVTEIELLKKMKECVITLLQIDKNIKQGQPYEYLL